jgi:Ca2+-binding EF-hand superfamily protein
MVASIVVGLAIGSFGPAQAQDREAYQARSIARYVETFTWLDMDQDEKVTRVEADGNVEFTATFDDIDINRDGSVTRAELQRFLTHRFGSARTR